MAEKKKTAENTKSGFFYQFPEHFHLAFAFLDPFKNNDAKGELKTAEGAHEVTKFFFCTLAPCI